MLRVQVVHAGNDARKENSADARMESKEHFKQTKKGGLTETKCPSIKGCHWAWSSPGVLLSVRQCVIASTKNFEFLGKCVVKKKLSEHMQFPPRQKNTKTNSPMCWIS